MYRTREYEQFVQELAYDTIAKIAKFLDPEAVFDKKALEQWARDNGFFKKDDVPAEAEELGYVLEAELPTLGWVHKDELDWLMRGMLRDKEKEAHELAFQEKETDREPA